MINHPHDHFFKGYMGEKENAQAFIQHFMPQEILDCVDVGTIMAQKDSFIDEKMRERFSDLLFSVEYRQSPAFVYFLFEHKSYLDPMVGFQLLKSIVSIWQKYVEQEKAKVLPAILPLVFYHGADEWNISTQFHTLVHDIEHLPASVRKSMPDFQYWIYDFSVKKQIGWIKDESLRMFIEISHVAFETDKEKVLAALKRAHQSSKRIKDRQRAIRLFQLCLLYVMEIKEDLETSEIEDAVAEEPRDERGGDVPTVAEKLRNEGKEIGTQIPLVFSVDRFTPSW